MLRASARGTHSVVVSRTSVFKSMACSAWRRFAPGSARASVSSWLIRCAVCSVAVVSCPSVRRTSPGSVCRSASSVWVLMPARGVRSWCAASAMKRCCADSAEESRASKSFIACTSARTSPGAFCSGSAERSRCERLLISFCSAASGRKPRSMPNQTSAPMSAINRSSGSSMPSRTSFASVRRLFSVSATRISAG